MGYISLLLESSYMAKAGGSTEEVTEEVQCPVGGCEYVGEPPSVEAHISGSSDDAHSGMTGRDFRPELVETEDGTGDVDQFDSYPNVAEDVDSTEDQEITEGSSNGAATSPGIPTEVVVIGVVGLVAIWLILSNPSDPTPPATNQEIEEQEDNQVQALGGER
jgi:hypothetical protein